ncbi:hypothetical protein [Arthrobacter cavernae]|uniref:Uncharacterized protein n=1 Tax=Arthrobacter cavernae TaxID=2817681 RepID=A0A939HID5_9MICC|nr:hypothetical protein [Arthrobacter cavernae]MBO1268010.1 hypothetical protein [Arthrobacter cavernae]
MKIPVLVAAGVGAVALSAAVFLAPGASASDPETSSTLPQFRVENVKVSSPPAVGSGHIVDTTFSNPLKAEMADGSLKSLQVFHAPHWDHDTPHSHDAKSVTLTNGDRTARVILGRALHSENPPCDTKEPRCSDDKLEWVIKGATDIHGQTLSDSSWRVWAEGSKD